MRFEWDDAKAALNLAKHNVSFREAAVVFGDPRALYREDQAHSKEERRRHVMGRSERGSLPHAPSD